MTRHPDSKPLPILFPAIVLITVTLLVYGGSLHHQFVGSWDDNLYVAQNSDVHGFSRAHIAAVFSKSYLGNYAPLQMLSYMVDYSFWGLIPYGYILTNIVLHAMNGVLFFILLRRINGRQLWPLAAALIFLLHPVQVESVVWVSQRKNCLSLLFFLLSFNGYLLYRQAETAARRYYLLSVAAFLLSLLAKSSAVVLPFLLLLFDLCHRDFTRKQSRFADKIPYLAAAGVMAVVTVRTQTLAGGIVPNLYGNGPLATLYTMAPVLTGYLRLIFWPDELSALYFPAIRQHPDAAVILALALIALLALAGVMLYRRQPRLFFWYGLFFISLVPVLQIIPINTLMNDRYLYLPMLGMSAFISALVSAAVTRKQGFIPISAVICALVALSALSIVTIRRSAVWSNDYTLWADTIQTYPGQFFPHYLLGSVLLNDGHLEEAVNELTTAVSINPGHADSLNDLATTCFLSGDLDQAIVLLKKALAVNPNHRLARKNLGKALAIRQSP